MHVLWATVLHLALPAQENPKMRSFNIPSLALVMLAAACSGNPSAPATSQAAGPTTTELVAKFDASAGELPEGLVFTREAAYVGFAPTSQVMRVDVGTGRATQYAQLPAPVAGKGFMTGLAESPTGDLYAGLASFVPEVQAGIYRVSKQSGEVSLFARDAALPFPNGLAFDASGALFATDSGSGSIFRFDAHGNAERWSSDQTLLGDAKACDGAGPGFAIGANGIVVEPDAVYVVNLDQATLLRFPRAEDGSAGSVTIVAGPDCETLGGADGLARVRTSWSASPSTARCARSHKASRWIFRPASLIEEPPCSLPTSRSITQAQACPPTPACCASPPDRGVRGCCLLPALCTGSRSCKMKRRVLIIGA
jgi:hypothetical protein